MLRCGVDLIEVERVEESLNRFGERFYTRFFTSGERSDCGDQIFRLAARIAAKEAVSKALGTGIGDVKWIEIEIRVNNPRKRPTLQLHGQAAIIAENLGLQEWDISLSHTKSHAMAMAVATGA